MKANTTKLNASTIFTSGTDFNADSKANGRIVLYPYATLKLVNREASSYFSITNAADKQIEFSASEINEIHGALRDGHIASNVLEHLSTLWESRQISIEPPELDLCQSIIDFNNNYKGDVNTGEVEAIGDLTEGALSNLGSN